MVYNLPRNGYSRINKANKCHLCRIWNSLFAELIASHSRRHYAHCDTNVKVGTDRVHDKSIILSTHTKILMHMVQNDLLCPNIVTPVCGISSNKHGTPVLLISMNY